MEDVPNIHGGKQQIHAVNRIIPLKLHCILLHVPIMKTTLCKLGNIPRIHLTSDQPWYPVCLNDNTKGQVIYPDVGDADDDLDNFIRSITNYSLELDVKISEIYTVDMLAWTENYHHFLLFPPNKS